MKKLTRLYDEDLRELVAEKFGINKDQVTSVYTEECVGYGMAEHMQPVFYIEVEENARIV